MIGLVLWKQEKQNGIVVAIREQTILHMRFCAAEVFREEKTPELLLRRRIRWVLRKLRKEGVTQVVLPVDFPYKELLEKQGLRPVPTLALRRRLAADWVRAALAERDISPGSARVAVAAERISGEVVRTVTELALRHRYVLLDLPQGGEELCRQLRREYGVTPLLAPSGEQLAEAEALVLFDRRESGKNPVCLRLFDESQPLPGLLLPPALERQLPQGVDRVSLLAALQEAGALKPGQITLEASGKTNGKED